MCQILLIYWKSLLLNFGGLPELAVSKAALCGKADNDEDDESFITTSPLDYHLFRQEIISKYPAYSPPPPLVPIEDQNNSILPPLSTHPSRQASEECLQTIMGPDSSHTRASIFHKPVHIATPAPSPPPSPAGPGGKGGKKQNYQTNQNFPFLYPPLNDTGSNVGVGGNPKLQQLVSRKWEGSDVPASILEAGQLFASRMRMSRSLRQLWDVREDYVKYERGWNGSGAGGARSDDCASDSDDVDAEERADKTQEKPRKEGATKKIETEDEEAQDRLDAINEFYVGHTLTIRASG